MVNLRIKYWSYIGAESSSYLFQILTPSTSSPTAYTQQPQGFIRSMIKSSILLTDNNHPVATPIPSFLWSLNATPSSTLPWSCESFLRWQHFGTTNTIRPLHSDVSNSNGRACLSYTPSSFSVSMMLIRSITALGPPSEPDGQMSLIVVNTTEKC
jgi:hypothetical protein